MLADELCELILNLWGHEETLQGSVDELENDRTNESSQQVNDVSGVLFAANVESVLCDLQEVEAVQTSIAVLANDDTAFQYGRIFLYCNADVPFGRVSQNTEQVFVSHDEFLQAYIDGEVVIDRVVLLRPVHARVSLEHDGIELA